MASKTQNLPAKGPYKPFVIIHGGAGSITRTNLPPALYKQYESSLQSYLESTYDILNATGSSLLYNGDRKITSAANAVEAATHAVCLLEEDPLFNCGHGSVFNTAGEIQMEASLAVSSVSPRIPTSLPGHVKKSAAVSMLTQTRHPILLAKEVLAMADGNEGASDGDEREESIVSFMHGHLSGDWVEQWGWEKGLEKKPKQWFWTRKRWNEHRRGLGLDYSDRAWKSKLDGAESEFLNYEPQASANLTKPPCLTPDIETHDLPSQGTVGAVCLDSWGNLAVATSTGGLTNKRPGRVGDTPTVGAGFWAESWDKDTQVNVAGHHRPVQHSQSNVPTPFPNVLNLTAPDLSIWLSGCLPSFLPPPHSHPQPPSQAHGPKPKPLDSPITIKQPSPLLPPQHTSHRIPSRVAIALSGTGNGDSFLRLNAARSVGAIARFSSPGPSLAKAVSSVVGRDGALQQSAEERWGQSGEGEGGIIGIEAVGWDVNDSEEKGKVEAKVVFDFNCGGMWRAYFVDDGQGGVRSKVMVFREEYV